MEIMIPNSVEYIGNSITALTQNKIYPIQKLDGAKWLTNGKLFTLYYFDTDNGKTILIYISDEGVFFSTNDSDFTANNDFVISYKRPKIVKAPYDCPEYFTSGKLYPVDGHIGEFENDEFCRQYGHGFYLIADDGYRASVHQMDTSDPDRGIWEVVEWE